MDHSTAAALYKECFRISDQLRAMCEQANAMLAGVATYSEFVEAKHIVYAGEDPAHVRLKAKKLYNKCLAVSGFKDLIASIMQAELEAGSIKVEMNGAYGKFGLDRYTNAIFGSMDRQAAVRAADAVLKG